MKTFNNISRKWRKLTAVLLLLNFISTPLLLAFPEEKCDEACEMVMPHHECNSETMQMEDSCCDIDEISLIDANQSTATECGMEITDVNCALIITEQSNTSYIIPKTVDSKVDLVLLPFCNVVAENSNIVISNYSQEISLDTSPPIYLMVSSFLN